MKSDLPEQWQVGLIVGPSGTGKTSIGKSFFDTNRIEDIYSGWDKHKPRYVEINFRHWG